jgi:hypothetical protein
MSFTDGVANLLLDPPGTGDASAPDPTAGGGPAPVAPSAPNATPAQGGLSLGAPTVAVYGPEHWAAADAVSSALMPTLSAALQTPPGLLTKDRVLGDTARMLATVRAGGVLSNEQFGQLMTGAAGFLGGVPDGSDESARRAALVRLGLDHMAARTRLAGMTNFTTSDATAATTDGAGADGGESGSDGSDSAPSPGAAQNGSAGTAAADGEGPASGTREASTGAGSPAADGQPRDGGDADQDPANTGETPAVDSNDSQSKPAPSNPDGSPSKVEASPPTDDDQGQASRPEDAPRPGSWLDKHRGDFILASSATATAPAGAPPSRAPALSASELAKKIGAIAEAAELPALVVAGGVGLKMATDADTRNQVNAAIKQFNLNPNRRADVQAAVAYVWSQTHLPWRSSAPTTGPGLEAAAQAVMRLEQLRPDTVYHADRGDPVAQNLIRDVADAAIDDWKSNSTRGPRGESRALQSNTDVARARLGLQPNDNIQVHHLNAVNTWRKFLWLQRLAAQDGWEVDGLTNLIALPGNFPTQAKMAAEGVNLPVHNFFHRDYDIITTAKISIALSLLGHQPNPQEARTILDAVAQSNRKDIERRLWHPILH